MRPRSALLAVLLFVASFAQAGEPLHGNTKSHVFHQASCRYYTCPNCTAKFDSIDEARAAGYRPCGYCGAAQTRAAAAGAAYVGNVKSHKFHRSSCRYAGCANCTAKFATREEAIEAGYAPGGCCDP